MLHELYIILFPVTVGFTASGIAANLYRLSVGKREVRREVYLVAMVLAGPSVLFDNAARSWRTKACSGTAFGLASALVGYWSFAIGLLVLSIVLAV